MKHVYCIKLTNKICCLNQLGTNFLGFLDVGFLGVNDVVSWVWTNQHVGSQWDSVPKNALQTIEWHFVFRQNQEILNFKNLQPCPLIQSFRDGHPGEARLLHEKFSATRLLCKLSDITSWWECLITFLGIFCAAFPRNDLHMSPQSMLCGLQSSFATDEFCLNK